jgi:hypothetical protein
MPAKNPVGLSSVHTRANIRVPSPFANPPDVKRKRGTTGQRCEELKVNNIINRPEWDIKKKKYGVI